MAKYLNTICIHWEKWEPSLLIESTDIYDEAL